jgi:subtilisin family serine protease
MINLAPAKTFLQEKGINPGGARDIIVAVIDTGVDYKHVDLQENIWKNPKINDQAPPTAPNTVK